MSDAFSAIISTEALRLADGMVGMIEASTTRRPSRPRTRSWSSTTAVGSLSGAMRQVPMRWKVVVPRCLAAVISSSSDCFCARKFLALVVCAERRRAKQPARQFHAGQQHLPPLSAAR